MSLDVHLHGARIGILFPAGEDDYRLAYAPETLEWAGAGPLLSNALPVRFEPYDRESSRAYVEGLLPEGMRRRKLAAELGVDPADGYALIAALGRDCPGAVTFLPAGEEAEPCGGGAEPDWLVEDELEELVATPPRRLFDPEREPRMRFALGGDRHKLALVREGERWAWPGAGVPSTHIVKPETGEHPELVPNEMFCTGVLREAGLWVAEAEVVAIAGRRCLVSPRFDRAGEGRAAVRRHQETLCQALGLAPGAPEGSTEAELPGFAEAVGLMRAIGRPDDAVRLVAATIAHYVIGNGDAHGRNFGLLAGEDGPGLAPLYDVSSTLVYDDPLHTGMVIARDADETISLLELGWVAEECDLDFEILRALAATAAEKIGKAIEKVRLRARQEDWHAPVVDQIAELATERALGLGYEVEY